MSEFELSAAETCSIYKLSTEILQLIFELCHPDDFEAAVLFCRWLYHAAGSLIPRHNECRQRILRSPGLERTITGYTVIRDPSDFLKWLLTIPQQLQIEQLRYFNRVVFIAEKWTPYAYRQDILDRLAADSTGLHSVITRTENELWNTPETEYKGPQDFSTGRDPSAQFDHANHSVPADPYYHVLLLGLFTSLKSLIVHPRTFTMTALRSISMT
jgi:hypothetical protein